MLQTKTFRRAVSASLVAGCVAFAGAASAGDDVSLSYHAYELASAGGVHALYQRIEQRAASHCLSSGRRPIEVARAEQDCAHAVVNDLVAKIDHPQLTRLHRDLANPMVANR